MPLPNRVDPFGNLFETPARGTLLGNRGGRFHADGRALSRRRWTSKQWICCELQFKNRHRDVWGRGYTELFFLDEVTGFAAGHRPCFECRRQEAELFALLFAGTDPWSARPRESGDPELDSRLRGNERNSGRATAKTMDDILHAERLAGRQKRIHTQALYDLPDGAMIVIDREALAVRGRRLLPWTPAGYGPARARPHGIEVDVLTPPSILTVLARGYTPRWHGSAA